VQFRVQLLQQHLFCQMHLTKTQRERVLTCPDTDLSHTTNCISQPQLAPVIQKLGNTPLHAAGSAHMHIRYVSLASCHNTERQKVAKAAAHTGCSTHRVQEIQARGGCNKIAGHSQAWQSQALYSEAKNTGSSHPTYYVQLVTARLSKTPCLHCGAGLSHNGCSGSTRTCLYNPLGHPTCPHAC
jgi:hypothetical protein